MMHDYTTVNVQCGEALGYIVGVIIQTIATIIEMVGGVYNGVEAILFFLAGVLEAYPASERCYDNLSDLGWEKSERPLVPYTPE